MKRGLYIITLLLILPIVQASEEEQIYSGSVTGDQIIEAEGYTFEVRVAGNVGAYINHENRSFIVKQSQCSWDRNLQFCVGTTSYAYRNSTTWGDVYSISLTVIEKSGFEINKTIEKRRLLIGEKTKVSLKLINDGVNELKNLVLTDAYPYELEVSNVEGCTLAYNIVQWRGTLAPNTQQKCTFILLGTEPIENRSEAQIEYTEGTERKTAASDRIIIRVQNHSLKITPTINITKSGINGSIDISLLIENIYTREIEVSSFDIAIPKSFSVVRNSGEIISRGQGFFWEGVLEREQQKQFNFTIQPTMSGNFTIGIGQRYTEAGFERNLKWTIPLAVECNCIRIQHKVSRHGGQPYLTVSLFNPSYGVKYSNLAISSTLDGIVQQRSIAPREDLLLYKSEVAEGDIYNITVDYDSDYGQHFTENVVIPILPEEREASQETESSSGLPEAPVDSGQAGQNQTGVQQIEDDASKLKNRALIVLIAVVLLGIVAIVLLKRRH